MIFVGSQGGRCRTWSASARKRRPSSAMSSSPWSPWSPSFPSARTVSAVPSTKILRFSTGHLPAASVSREFDLVPNECIIERWPRYEARRSGIGREGGSWSFDFYADVKNVCTAPWKGEH